MANDDCLNSSACVKKTKCQKLFLFFKRLKLNAYIKCDTSAPAKNLNVRKQKYSIWCDVIAVLLPFVPKT